MSLRKEVLFVSKSRHCLNFCLKGAFLDIVAKCEISRVLLLMLLEVIHGYNI